MAPANADFNAQLEGQGKSLLFGHRDFNLWSCVQLRQLIKLFGPTSTFKRGHSKLDLCVQLLDIKANALTLAEQRAVDVIWERRPVEPATKLLSHQPATPSDNSTDSGIGIKRRHSEVEVKVEEVRPGEALPDIPAETVSETLLECDTCMSDVPSSNFLPMAIDASCTHLGIKSCKGCVTLYIQTQAQCLPLDNIKCPDLGCNAMLSYEHMRQYAPAELFRRYDEYIMRKTFEQMPDYYACSKPGCGAGGLCLAEDEASISFMTCDNCGTRTCITCDTLWHPQYTHDQNLAKIKESITKTSASKARDETKSMKLVERESKACPKDGCGARIEKTNGFDHMTCKSRHGTYQKTLTYLR